MRGLGALLLLAWAGPLQVRSHSAKHGSGGGQGVPEPCTLLDCQDPNGYENPAHKEQSPERTHAMHAHPRSWW